MFPTWLLSISIFVISLFVLKTPVISFFPLPLSSLPSPHWSLRLLSSRARGRTYPTQMSKRWQVPYWSSRAASDILQRELPAPSVGISLRCDHWELFRACLNNPRKAQGHDIRPLTTSRASPGLLTCGKRGINVPRTTFPTSSASYGFGSGASPQKFERGGQRWEVSRMREPVLSLEGPVPQGYC